MWPLSANNKGRWKIALEKELFIVAQINKKYVGFGSLKKVVYFDSLYVDKDYLRHVIATEIFNNLVDESKM